VCTSAAFAGVLACSKNPAQGPQAAGMQAMPVKVMEAKAMPVNDASEYVATLKSRDSAVIMPQVDGQITQIFIHSGENVSAGTGLMEIDPLKQQATVKSLESARTAQQATLSWTTQQYERAKGLAAAGVVSKQDLDQAKAAMDAAQAQMDALGAQVREQEVQLHYYKVVAPRGGIVGDIPVRVGDRVTNTTQLTTVDQPGSLEAYVYVPVSATEDELAGSDPGQHRQGSCGHASELHFSAGGQHNSDGSGQGAHRQRKCGSAAVAVHSRPAGLGDAPEPGGSNSGRNPARGAVFCVRG